MECIEEEEVDDNEEEEEQHLLSRSNTFKRLESFRGSFRNFHSSRRRYSTISFGNKQRRLSTFSLLSLSNHYSLGYLTLDVNEEKKMNPIEWLRHFEFYLVGICYLSSRLIYMTSISYIVYYVKFTLLLETKFKAVVPLVMFSSGFVMAAIVEGLRKHIGMKIIFLVACTLGLGKYNYELGFGLLSSKILYL